MNPRTGEYETVGSVETAPIMWSRIESSGWLLRLLAALHNPLNAVSIVRSDPSEIIDAYGGADDPMVLGGLILRDLEHNIKKGG